MNNKTIIISILVVAAVAFASGRYSAPAGETKTVTIHDQVKSEEDLKKNIHTVTQTTTVKEPTGETKVTTTTDTVATTDDIKSKTEVKDETVKTITAPKGGQVTVSALAGMSIHQVGTPVYGVAVTKQFIGPIAIGAFGFNNGLIGVSAGVSF